MNDPILKLRVQCRSARKKNLSNQGTREGHTTLLNTLLIPKRSYCWVDQRASRRPRQVVCVEARVGKVTCWHILHGVSMEPQWNQARMIQRWMKLKEERRCMRRGQDSETGIGDVREAESHGASDGRTPPCCEASPRLLRKVLPNNGCLPH